MIFYIVTALLSYLPLYAVMTRNKNREHIRRGEIILTQKERLVNTYRVILLYIKFRPRNTQGRVTVLYNCYHKLASLNRNSAGFNVIAEKYFSAER